MEEGSADDRQEYTSCWLCSKLLHVSHVSFFTVEVFIVIIWLNPFKVNHEIQIWTRVFLKR